MVNKFQEQHMQALNKMAAKEKLPTVGEILDALSGIDRNVEISLSFLPIEGGHRGPNAANVPFRVDPVEDADGKMVFVHLTES